MFVNRIACLSLLLGACATAPMLKMDPEASSPANHDSRTVVPALLAAAQDPVPPDPRRGPPSNHWRQGEAAMTGYFGVGIWEFDREGGNTGNISDEDFTVPTLGGGGQFKLGGDRIDVGVEAFLGVSWAGGVSAFAVGGGGAAVAVDVDMFAFELYGGPFASMFLGDGIRLYAGAGPMIEWALYDQSSGINAASGDGSGFGVGWYARTGLEFKVGGGSMVGAGVRWSDVELDLSGGLGDLQVDGFMVFASFTQGF